MLSLISGLRAPSMAGLATRSLRFRSSASAYLSKAVVSVSTDKLWTYSTWVKRSKLDSNQHIYSAAISSASYSAFYFNASNQLVYQQADFNVIVFALTTTQVFRDISSWYHIALVYDAAQATSTNRVKLYVNGSQITSFSAATYPSLNLGSYIANTVSTAGSTIGRFAGLDIEHFDGHLTEINFVTAQALTPLSFGSINETTGVWLPKRFAGAYGTNGFYLKFVDASAATATAIGKDYSGNGNNWTPNNISVTVGVTYDSSLDIVNNNYCTINYNNSNRENDIVDANSRVAISNIRGATSTFPITTGSWYCEMSFTATSGFSAVVGVVKASVSLSAAGNDPVFNNGWGYISNGSKRILGADTAYASAWNAGDVIGLAYNANTRMLYTYINGVAIGVGISVSGTDPVVFAAYGGSGSAGVYAYMNFGQRGYTHGTPNPAYLSLNSLNLPTLAVVNGASTMAATAYTGTGAGLTITNTNNSVSFQPDFVWLKGRSGATDHALYDSVRGVTLDLVSNSTAAETTQATGLTALNTGGFTVGALAKLNTAAATYIAWQWKAGGTAVSNTAGTITSQVSANTAAGFSVVTYTGTGANATVGHGLGVAPKFIIIKNRTLATASWTVYHASITATSYLALNTTAASAANIIVWNSVEPTLSVFSIGTGAGVGNWVNEISAPLVAYCFAEIAGYSKFGSYTGNGLVDGPFVNCGFKPRFIMVKASSTTGDWAMIDTSRSTFNVAGITSSANSAAAEAALLSIDILANGFKIRSATLNNTSAATYTFAAFAENSIKYALAN